MGQNVPPLWEAYVVCHIAFHTMIVALLVATDFSNITVAPNDRYRYKCLLDRG